MDPRTLLMHQIMLSDQRRLSAYNRAIHKTVSDGDTVADVGAGTLILSLMALRAGARHVYAVEGDPEMADLGRRIARENGADGVITVIEGDARKTRLDEPVDVVISELMGNLGPEEQMADTLYSFCQANLRAGGKVVPSRVDTVARAIEFDAEGWGIWSDRLYDWSFRAALDSVQSAPQMHFFQREPRVLAGPVQIATAEFGKPDNGNIAFGRRVDLAVEQEGTLHAFVGSFRADLAPGIELANYPTYPGSNWACWVWPVRHTPIVEGDALQIRLKRPPGLERYAESWTLQAKIRSSGAA